MFRDPVNAPELYDANRASGWNTAGAGGAALPASDVDISAGFAYSAFYSARISARYCVPAPAVTENPSPSVI
jgi:hypothetical protein